MSPSLISQFRGSHWYGVGKSKLVLGPFTGGINRVSDPTFVAPNELQECINYLIKPDGRLVGRPPITAHGASKGLPAGSFNMIGTTVSGSLRAGTSVHGPIVFDSVGLRAWLYNYSTGNWTTIWGAFPGTTDAIYKVDLYTGIYYFLGFDSINAEYKFLKATGVGTTVPTNIAAFTTLVNTAVGVGASLGGLNNPELLFLKDRAVVVGGSAVLWSKATDPSVWTTPDGGFVKYSGGNVIDSFVFEDAIYIFGDAGIWRFTWGTDPSVDGVFEHLSKTGILGAAVYNNEIYVATADGIFKFVNGFFVEISQKISLDWQNWIKLLTASIEPTLNIIENYLFVGPIGSTTQLYYVYDLKLGIWTTWYIGSGSNVVRGPYVDNVHYAGSSLNLGIKQWIWTSAGHVHSIPANALTMGAVYNGNDINEAGNFYWMGFRVTTAELDLGEGVKWKRIFKSLLEALYTAVTFTSGTSKINLLLDGVATQLTPPDTGLLAWGKSFRAKRVALQYDSVGNTISTAAAQPVELNNIDRFHLYVRAAEEVTT